MYTAKNITSTYLFIGPLLKRLSWVGIYLFYEQGTKSKRDVLCVVACSYRQGGNPDLYQMQLSSNRFYQVSKQWAFEEQSIYLIISFLHVMHFIYIIIDAETLSHTNTRCQRLQKPKLQLRITRFSVLWGHVYFKIVEKTRTWYWKKLVLGSCIRSQHKLGVMCF